MVVEGGGGDVGVSDCLSYELDRGPVLEGFGDESGTECVGSDIDSLLLSVVADDVVNLLG